MMAAHIRTTELYVLECDEHSWFSGATRSKGEATDRLAEHNHLFHNDPDKEESWPTSNSLN